MSRLTIKFVDSFSFNNNIRQSFIFSTMFHIPTYTRTYDKIYCIPTLTYKFSIGLIYIVGGCTHNSRHRQDVLSYNPVTREWNYLAPMITPRSQMGITILDGYMYVVGGTSKNQEVLTSVERYSFEKVIYFRLSFIFNIFKCTDFPNIID